MRLAVLLALLTPLALAPAARAQVVEPAPLVVMNLAAHPDDEDGATMAYYRHVKNAVVYSVIFTRGEGGQNEIGPELYERLGALRTAETEAAARILGTQVYYLNFFDFGYSKWASETFAEWSRPRSGFWDTDHPIVSEAAGRDSVTARLVHLIRLLKPDVVFTNHDTVTVAPRAQHGHHQAVGITAWDAFALASDSSYHPEQLREPGVDLWQPQRLFIRTRAQGSYDVAVPVGDDCGGGETCGDRAVRAAVLHRSQGFDLLAPRFFRRDTSYFVSYRQANGAPPLPGAAEDLAIALPPNHVGGNASTFAAINAGRTDPLPGGVYPDTDVGVPGQRIRLKWAGPGSGRGVTLFGPAASRAATEPVIGDTLTARIAPNAPVTLPRHRALYDHPTVPAPLSYRFGPTSTSLVSRSYRGSFFGHVPLDIAPPIVVDLAPAPVRLVAGANVVRASVRTYDPAADAVTVRLIVGQRHQPGAHSVAPLYSGTLELKPADTSAVFRFNLPSNAAAGEYRVTVEATANPTSAPAEPYVETRPAAILPDIRVAEGLRVGFVRSYDETTENVLRAMGADVVLLDSTALADGRFEGLHTIVLDIRAYLARPDLRAHNGRLLDWVRAGGHLVVGYQKTFEWNPGAPDPTQPEESGAVNPDFAPYPLVLGRDRVVREDAPVELLAPAHPLFTAPHAIGVVDWAGWVQERGLYFPETYDPRYAELLAMSDPGEPALRGGLLLAGYGEGTYLYSPLVWYRQLEALNAGAWRLFANLVSLPLVRG